MVCEGFLGFLRVSGWGLVYGLGLGLSENMVAWLLRSGSWRSSPCLPTQAGKGYSGFIGVGGGGGLGLRV